ncbi:hypothetical protein Kisp01_67590 [Kineosporia sp. NBRC 101677]|uniref:hypothetical protein n=1 Tax=Kineosporia sp. NBRC 101677 TaxID=3032197 RepID=UPI0024A2D74B|nr:hypothetical protein [Kineosporia sp. NBRC 101677]GLY19745.1 hypothetical protein Kisp01_67590 [Kineosporia sp. NBRC 101677]
MQQNTNSNPYDSNGQDERHDPPAEQHHGTADTAPTRPPAAEHDEISRLKDMLTATHRAEARAGEVFAVAVMQGSHYVLPIRLPQQAATSTPGGTPTSQDSQDQARNTWAQAEADILATAAEHEAGIDAVHLFAFSPQAHAYAQALCEQESRLPLTVVPLYVQAQHQRTAGSSHGTTPPVASTAVTSAPRRYRVAVTVLEQTVQTGPHAVVFDAITDVMLEDDEVEGLRQALGLAVGRLRRPLG